MIWPKGKYEWQDSYEIYNITETRKFTDQISYILIKFLRMFLERAKTNVCIWIRQHLKPRVTQRKSSTFSISLTETRIFLSLRGRPGGVCQDRNKWMDVFDLGLTERNEGVSMYICLNWHGRCDHLTFDMWPIIFPVSVSPTRLAAAFCNPPLFLNGLESLVNADGVFMGECWEYLKNLENRLWRTPIIIPLVWYSEIKFHYSRLVRIDQRYVEQEKYGELCL